MSPLFSPHSSFTVYRALLVAIQVSLLFSWLPMSAVAQDSPPVHVVQPGDTLSEIAQQYATTTQTLRQLNGLGDVDFVWVGQRLALPDEELSEDAVDRSSVDRSTTNPVSADAESAVVEAATEAAVTSETEAETEIETEAEVDPTTLPAPVVATDLTTDIYVVQADDTLTDVARRHRTTLAHLIELNQIALAQRLQQGQALVVPVSGRAVAAIPTVEPLLHKVVAGEHLGTIAAHYAVTTAAIVRANRLTNASLIVPGQELLIPQGVDLAEVESYLHNLRTGRDGYHVHTEFPTLTEKWIDVDLSEQRLVAYRGKKPIKSFSISSGLPGTPTVTGTFRIWAKTPIQDMYAGNRAAGYSYYIEDVQWVQYFYKDYGFHGAYWHNNFGQPMSHGCINLRNADAKWLFDWASPTIAPKDGWFISDEENPGTLVVVHD